MSKNERSEALGLPLCNKPQGQTYFLPLKTICCDPIFERYCRKNTSAVMQLSFLVKYISQCFRRKHNKLKAILRGGGKLLFEIKGYGRLVTHTECVWLREAILPIHKLTENNTPRVQRLLSLF